MSLITFGNSFVKLGNGIVSYEGPILPPSPPTANYFKFTNRGNNTATLYITSGSRCVVFVNDEFIVKGQANNTVSVEVPANGVVKITGLTPRGSSANYGTIYSDSASNYITLDRWDESVTNPDYMFCRFTGLREVTSWEGAGNYTKLHDTFTQTSTLTTIPPSWEGLGNVTQLIGSFNSCSLTAIPSSYAGLGKLTQATHTFVGNSTLVSGGDTGFDNLSDVTLCDGMFGLCPSWTGDGYALYEYLSTKSIPVTSHYKVFEKCTSCIGYYSIPGSWGGGLENPLNLPAYTIRLKYADGVTPTFSSGTATQVTSSPNVWDLTYNNSSWSQLLRGDHYLIEVLGANTENVTNMWFIFGECPSLTKVALFDTSKVTVVEGMFYKCSSLASVPLFDLTSVTYTGVMFRECSSLTSVPLFDTSNVTNMDSMFYDCTSLITVPLFDTSKVTKMTFLFRGCSSLTTVPLFDTSKVTNMNTMLYGCSSLTSVPLFDTSSCTSMVNMLASSSITTVPLFDTSKVTDMSYMFNGCTNVQSGAYELYKQALTQTNVPTSHTDTFKNCGSNTQTGLSDLNKILTTWGGNLSLPTTYFEFSTTTGVTLYVNSPNDEMLYRVDNGDWLGLKSGSRPISLLTGKSYKFANTQPNTSWGEHTFKVYNTTSKDLQISKFDATLTSLKHIFSRNDFRQVGFQDSCLMDITSWEGAENYTDFEGAFTLLKLRSIPNDWSKLKNITTLNQAFYGTLLTTIPTTNFDMLTNVTDVSLCFANCSNVTSDISPIYSDLVSLGLSWKAHGGVFHGCRNAINWNNIPTEYGGPFVNMFIISNTLENGGATLYFNSTPFVVTTAPTRYVTSYENGGFYNCTNSDYVGYDGGAVCYVQYLSKRSSSSSIFGSASNCGIIEQFDSTWTDISYMFMKSVVEVASWTGSENVYDCRSAFFNNTYLKKIAKPLTAFSNAIQPLVLDDMFNGCTNVESGILDMYNYLSALPNISSHSGCFRNCGSNTTTGQAELDQIPSDWK